MNNMIVTAFAAALAFGGLGTIAEANAQAQVKPQVRNTPGSQARAPSAAATVNGVVVPQAEIERLVRAAVARGAKDEPALRARLRDQLVGQELIYQEALKRQLDRSPQYKEAMYSVERRLLGMFLLKTIPFTPVTEADVRTVYDRTMSNLAQNDVKIGAIVVSGQAQIGQVWSQLARGGDFSSLARSNSILPSARAGGILGWTNLRTDQADKSQLPLPQAVAVAARKLTKGGFSQPTVDGEGRWWIVTIVDTRPSRPVPYSLASKSIRTVLENRARAQAQREFLENLRMSAVIK